MPTPELISDLLAEAAAFHQNGEMSRAVELYQKILESDPENADAWNLMGVAAHQQGKNDLAVSLIKNAIGLKDDFADFHSNLGQVHRALGADDAADLDYRRALEINPRHIKALSNLASVLRSTGQFSAAVDYARRAVQAGPDDPEAQINLGNALKDMNWTEDAIATYRKAIELAPDYALAHWNLSLALLSLAQYEEGFLEMKWRWQWAGFPAQAREFDQPLLNEAGSLEGKTVLLHAEQGLGDTIHFIRYGQMLRAGGLRVVFECPGALIPLIEGTELVDEVVRAGEVLPDFDAHAGLLDLPHFLATRRDTIPAVTPYLSVPIETGKKWQGKVAAKSGLKIGLNWRGNSESPAERFRAVPPGDLARLADLDGIAWFSLQKGNDPEDASQLGADFPLIDTGPEPLQETAGLIQALDLIITSDTAVAHLAGALGKPVWILLHHAADWRWLRETEDNPWYPTARLFRQKQPGAWSSVVDEVKAALIEKLG